MSTYISHTNAVLGGVPVAMKPTAILDLMVKDHRTIVKLLKEVEKNLDADSKTLTKAFDTLNWNLEKHIFTEEKAIFTSYSPVNVIEGYKMVPELIKQHNVILNKMNLMRTDLMKKKPIDFHAFTELLTEHKTYEENFLYPQLDQELGESQKKVIIERILELVE